MNAFHRHENGQHHFWTHFWFGLTVGGWVEGGCSTGVDTRPASVCAELVAPSRHNSANELAGTRNIPRFMAERCFVDYLSVLKRFAGRSSRLTTDEWASNSLV